MLVLLFFFSVFFVSSEDYKYICRHKFCHDSYRVVRDDLKFDTCDYTQLNPLFLKCEQADKINVCISSVNDFSDSEALKNFNIKSKVEVGEIVLKKSFESINILSAYTDETDWSKYLFEIGFDTRCLIYATSKIKAEKKYKSIMDILDGLPIDFEITHNGNSLIFFSEIISSLK